MRVGGLADAIACVVGWFKDRGAPFCLVGGLAVSFRTIERATRDVDLVVAVASDQDADECVRELREIGFAAVEIFQRKESGAVSTVRMLSSSFPGIYVDLLFFACGIEREIVESATEIEILPGVIVPTATMSSLIAMKVLSSGNKRRRQDLLDLEHLIADASQAEILESQKLVSLINARGFNSGRDLEKVLKDLLADMS